MQIRAYLMAIDGIPIGAVSQAARLYITGQVKDHNRDFAPSCASFAEQARYQQAVIDAASRPKIEAKPIDASPRVAPEKLLLLQKALHGSTAAREELTKMLPHLDLAPPQKTGEQE